MTETLPLCSDTTYSHSWTFFPMPALMCHIHNKLFPLHTSQKKTSYKNKNYLALFSKTRTAVCSFSLFSSLIYKVDFFQSKQHSSSLYSFTQFLQVHFPKRPKIDSHRSRYNFNKSCKSCQLMLVTL